MISRPDDAPSPPARWWTELYDDLLADVLLERSPGHDVGTTLDFIAGVLELAPGARVLDQCCGIGSLAVPLAQRGYRVVGIDQAPCYIERAQEAATKVGVSVELHAADAWEWSSPEPCGGAINWWTSFGYDESDGANARMLRRAFESLRPGASFALDTMNLAGVLRDFRPDWITRRVTPAGDKIVLLRESRVDLARGILHKTWTYFVDRDGRTERVTRDSSVRLYMPHQLAELLRSVGFERVRLFGSIAGEEVTLDSPRCIAVASRPV